MAPVYHQPMQITSTNRPNPARPQAKAAQPPSPQVSSSEPQDGWVGATLSVVGGMATLAGAVTNQPLLTAGGALTTAVGTGLTAQRVQKSGMDSAAWVSFGVGGGLTALGALTMMQPQAQSAGPTGPLPTFLRQIGVQTLG